MALLSAMLAAITVPAWAQDAGATPPPAAQKEDDGTDPTQLSRSADVTFEHLDLLNGFESQTLKFSLTIPVGESKKTSLRFVVPVSSNNARGNDSFALGDASMKLTRVLTVTRSYGVVVGGELAFDTAERAELGSGKTVFKGSFVYARFLKDGNLFAPAIVHSASVAGDDSRPRVSSTTLDLYYVPRLGNPKLFMTIDPAFTYDWESSTKFGSLAVTFGRKLGKMLGGNGQVFIKPSVLIGTERGANWGVQVGFKVLNF